MHLFPCWAAAPLRRCPMAVRAENTLLTRLCQPEAIGPKPCGGSVVTSSLSTGRAPAKGAAFLRRLPAFLRQKPVDLPGKPQ
jgi:hypothetical protein